jgi:Zn-dependent peptidase ImmA (M78 family)
MKRGDGMDKIIDFITIQKIKNKEVGKKMDNKYNEDITLQRLDKIKEYAYNYTKDLIKIPIDPILIAEKNNLGIININFNDNHVLGVVSNKFKFIGVEGKLNYEKKRFIIAHELGHYILEHMNKEKDEIKFYKTDLDNTSYCSDQEDSEANYFADCLLMPENFVIKIYQIYRKYTNSINVITNGMADQFSVPESMLKRRLVTLGIVNEYE